MDTIFHDSKGFRNRILHSNVPDFDNCAFDFFFYVENDSSTHYNSGSRNPKSRICYTKYLLFSLHHLYFHNISTEKKGVAKPHFYWAIFQMFVKTASCTAFYKKKDLTVHKSGLSSLKYQSAVVLGCRKTYAVKIDIESSCCR